MRFVNDSRFFLACMSSIKDAQGHREEKGEPIAEVPGPNCRTISPEFAVWASIGPRATSLVRDRSLPSRETTAVQVLGGTGGCLPRPRAQPDGASVMATGATNAVSDCTPWIETQTETRVGLTAAWIAPTLRL